MSAAKSRISDAKKMSRRVFGVRDSESCVCSNNRIKKLDKFADGVLRESFPFIPIVIVVTVALVTQ